MIPKGAQGIGNLVNRIGRDLIPRAADAYTATDLGYFTMLLGMVAQDYDRAADVLVAEHAALGSILSEASSHIEDAALRSRIADAIAAEPASLRVSDLATRGDATMRVLIDVHAEVESALAAGAAWAGPLNDNIWRFLETHVAAQAYDVPM
jgi:hypothetical protein